MSPNGLPDDLVRFIHQHLTSLEALEILLLTRRENGRDWSAAQVSSELRLDAASVARRLDDLVHKRLLVVDSSARSYRYAPTDMNDRNHVDQLATAYHERRGQVLAAVFSRLGEHIQVFSDAFKLRKD